MADQKIQVNCGFFDSINDDRLYAAEQMNKPYYRLISNGVFATPQGTPSTDFQVVASGEDMSVIVKKGDGMFADKWFENPSNISFEVPNNTAIVPRRDSIIAQVDKTTNGRAGNIVYRTGEPGSNPQTPEINTNANIVEYRIANIYVGAGVTIITQSNVTDLRGSAECPWITSLVKQVDTSELFRQYQAAYEEKENELADDFNTWFDRMKGQLSEDAAGHLQNEIDAIPNLIATAISAAEQRRHPIGSIEFNVSGANPATYLGFGTWVRWGEGKVPVSVDENDTDFDEAEKTSGSKTKRLRALIGAFRQSTNSIGYRATGKVPNKHINYDFSYGFFGHDIAYNIPYQDINHNTLVTDDDGNEDISNVQPSIACYMWKRTA